MMKNLHLGWAISLVVFGCNAQPTTKASPGEVDGGAFVRQDSCDNDDDCRSTEECITDPGTTQRSCEPRSEMPLDAGAGPTPEADAGPIEPPDASGPSADAGPAPAPDAGPAPATDAGPTTEPRTCVGHRDCASDQICNDVFRCAPGERDGSCFSEYDCAVEQVCNESYMCEAAGPTECFSHSDCNVGEECGAEYICVPRTGVLDCYLDIDCPSGEACGPDYVCVVE